MKTPHSTCDIATYYLKALSVLALGVASKVVNTCLRHTCDSLRHQQPATLKKRLNNTILNKYIGVACRRQVCV